MSDRHEAHIAKTLGGAVQKGSGNQWHNQTDVRQGYREEHYFFASDGKSTTTNSITITKAMWYKLCEQAYNHEPLMPLRFYTNARLTESIDLAVIDLDLLQRIVADANAYHRQLNDESGD